MNFSTLLLTAVIFIKMPRLNILGVFENFIWGGFTIFLVFYKILKQYIFVVLKTLKNFFKEKAVFLFTLPVCTPLPDRLTHIDHRLFYDRFIIHI